MSQSVIVLGASGMLGSMVLDVLSRETNLDVSATVRDGVDRWEHRYPHVTWYHYDAHNSEGLANIADHEWVINCIGITKPHIHEDTPSEVECAIRINALWPHQLARVMSGAGHRLLQIATDCVYSGHGGPYAEGDAPDAHDVYGRTKSLGETTYPGITNVRCSIIGPELGESKFLLEWVRRQPQNARLNGFTNSWWNGLTTLAFARICRGIIHVRPILGCTIHVVPRDIVNKHHLLGMIANAYDRHDLVIDQCDSEHSNMTLATHRPTQVEGLWSAAGYHVVPSIEQMVHEVALYQYQHDPVLVKG